MRKTPLNPYRLGNVIARPENFKLLDRFGLHRAEFVVFPPDARSMLEECIRERDIRYSVHCPLFIEPDYPENPLLASVADIDPARRKAALGLMERNLGYAAELKAEYMVMHLQRPCTFGCDNPLDFSEEQLFEAALENAAQLDEMARNAGVRVLLENQMDNPHFAQAATYIDLLDRFPDFGFCLDVGHLDVDARSFGVDFNAFVRTMAPRVSAIHLQNSRGGEVFDQNRYWKVPVHPTQRVEDGWRDIPWILRTVLDASPDCVINFESLIKFKENGVETAAEGIEWVRQILADYEEEKAKSVSGPNV